MYIFLISLKAVFVAPVPGCYQLHNTCIDSICVDISAIYSNIMFKIYSISLLVQAEIAPHKCSIQVKGLSVVSLWWMYRWLHFFTLHVEEFHLFWAPQVCRNFTLNGIFGYLDVTNSDELKASSQCIISPWRGWCEVLARFPRLHALSRCMSCFWHLSCSIVQKYWIHLW